MTLPAFHDEAFKTPKARRTAASLDDAIRRHMVRRLTYKYPGFREATDIIGRFHRSQKTGVPYTGSIGGVIGEFRSGKSFLVKHYLQEFTPTHVDGRLVIPTLYIGAQRDWNAKALPKRILNDLKRPGKSSWSVDDLTSAALARLSDMGVKLLVLDDFHRLIGRRKDVGECALELVRTAAEREICNVLLCGPRVVQTTIANQDELLGRGGFPIAPVRGFDPKTETGQGYFALFLEGVDDRLPFENPSNLAQEPIFSDLLSVSAGSIGFAMEVIKAAANLALDDDAPCVDVLHFRRAIQDRGALLARAQALGVNEEDLEDGDA